jgi:hypothetical protein
MGAPLKHHMYPVNIQMWVIISFLSQYFDLVNVQGALGNVICPLLR